MRKFVLLTIVMLVGFSVSCYQKDILPTNQRVKQRSVQQRQAQQRQSQQQPKVESGVLTDATNIHYNGKYCTVCHEQTPRNGHKYLKYGEDYKQLCSCHYKTSIRDIHPSDIEPPKEFKKRMPKDFPLRNGKISCITCHDVYAQCRDGKTIISLTSGKNFLRGAPYQKLTVLCFKCHDQTKFERYNPHDQLDKKGNIISQKCLYCHKKVPDVTKDKFKDVALIGDLDPLCLRCHNKADEKTLHARHLRKPSPDVLARMKQMEIEYGIVMPLNDDGKITCATCHNPHEKGVIPAGKAGAAGAGRKHRQRLTGNICIQCHKM